jgi:hypothetical protein
MGDTAVAAKMQAVAVSDLNVEISVVFGDETVKLNLCPEEFKFLEFESWLRSRFDLTAGDKVVFSDRKGNGKNSIHSAIHHRQHALTPHALTTYHHLTCRVPPN